MAENYRLLVFLLDGIKFSLFLENVDRVIQAVEITPLPKVPDSIMGIINVHGEILPILDIRRKFNLLQKKLTIHDKIIITKTPAKKFGFVVDDIEGYFETTAHAVIKGESVWPGMEYVDEVVKLSDELVLINNPEKFFIAKEIDEYNKAIKNIKPN
ncbi:MAG: hypothetical protein A2V66_18470 [Ignavibacteria bacterium RBG_13_36_8]|nr:MAG: hypothetical protein A2V66_18470 [Ignavibacteria bacterium RBG_13_36_8]